MIGFSPDGNFSRNFRYFPR